MPTAWSVRVPASTSNLGPGFDLLGLALGLYLEVDARTAAGRSHSLERRGEGAEELPGPDEDLLRSLAQSMARAYGPQGIHVAHVIVDGGIAGDKIVQGLPQFAEAMGEDGLVSLEGLADAYWFLHTQHRAAWTHELDLRTFKESF